MAHPTPDMEQVTEAISQLTRRLTLLENSFVSEEESLGVRESQLERQSAIIATQLETLRSEIKGVRETLTHLEQAFSKLTLDLRQSVKKDEIERLSSRIDRLNFEGFLSAKSLSRELEDAQASIIGEHREQR